MLVASASPYQSPQCPLTTPSMRNHQELLSLSKVFWLQKIFINFQEKSWLNNTIWRLLKKLNIDLPYDPAIPLLRIYPKECDSGYSRGTCTPMFIAALFTIAKLRK
jgi:hypothetical protein